MSGEFVGFVHLTVYWHLKTINIMAKFELKFIANDDEDVFIKVISEENQIVVTIENGLEFSTICLDKSTAIKFAKTLRTEINKITESEVGNE